jgi:cysteine desulfurase
MTYLDYNATTPVLPEVLEAMLPWFTERFGNAASSTHAFGWAASEAVNIARETIANCIDAEPAELLFCSGATEAINLALQGLAMQSTTDRRGIVYLATEHKAVIDTVKHLEAFGFPITEIPVDSNGVADLKSLESAIHSKTMVVCAMMVNNETGLIQPLEPIAELARRNGAFFLCDASQVPGKLPLNIQQIGADLLVLSAHKFYGPKGIGALYLRRRNPRVHISPLLFGGGHEKGLRSGTLNVPGIVGMAEALRLATENYSHWSQTIRPMRDELEKQILQISGVQISALSANRVYNTSHFRIDGLRASSLIKALPDLAFSTGSACSSAHGEPSHVCKAMGMNDTQAFEVIRISLGITLNGHEFKLAIEKLCRGIEQLRSAQKH